jgi:predicted DNA-binding transcriptional regulator YafY
MLAESAKGKIVEIDYTNWRGERMVRRIVPCVIVFCNTPHHPEAQWMIEAFDVERDGRPTRFFPLANIHSWKAAPQGAT